MSKVFISSEARRPIRWGIAGYGDIVRRRVASALANNAETSLVGIWGRNLRRAEELAEEFSAHGTNDLVGLCRNVDALYVATPVDTHVPLAIAACQAGCHVLIEKPLSMGLGDLEKLLACSSRDGQQIGIAYYRRLSPHIAWLRRAVMQGTFGAPRHVSVVFSAPFDPQPDDPKAWRIDRHVAGGGVLADAGSHRLDLLTMLFGRPKTIRARLTNFTPGGCERSAVVDLDWDMQFRAHLDVRWSSNIQDRMELAFEGADLIFDPLDCGVIQIRRRDGSLDSVGYNMPSNPSVALLDDFNDAIRVPRPPICNVADGLFIDHMILAAARSSAEGSEVSLCASTIPLNWGP